MVKDRPAGTFGDASVVSFGIGKIIDAGHGGAVLSSDKNLLREIDKIDARLNLCSKKSSNTVSAIDRLFTETYNRDLRANHRQAGQNFEQQAMRARDAYLYKFDDSYADKIVQKLSTITEDIGRRKKKARYLARRFFDAGISTFEPPEGSVYWRYNLFLDNKLRNQILIRFLDKGYRISSWFPSISRFFMISAGVKTPVSDWIDVSILNIMVDDEADESYLGMISDEIIVFSGTVKEACASNG